MTLYTTHCPRCRVLEAALKSKDIPYDICEDVDTMESLGFTEAPMLEVGGKYLNYTDAMKFIMEGIMT